VTSLSDYKTDDDGSRYDGEGKGKDDDSRGDKQVVFCDLKVEGYVIEERSNDQALD
jgi:hypothetical protein